MALQRSGLELAAQGANEYISDLTRAEGATNNFAGGLEGAAGRTNAAGSIMGGAAAAAGAAVVAGFAVAAGASVAFVADSVTAAGDFEAAVNNLAAVSGTALTEAGFSFDDVSAKALQLGQDTRFSASESIAAMTELVKGGVPVAEVMTTATDATLNLAAAAGVDLTNAAEIVAKQFGVWSDTGVSATEITDLLTQAANASTVGVEDLALGLAQAGGTAKVAGVEYDDLVQTMALIAPGFQSAADAGTSLKTMLSRLIPTTTPAKDAMYDLGLWTRETGSAFYDASGQFVGMEEAARLLQEATAGLSEEQKLLAFNTIFGQDAIRAAAMVAEGGAEAFNQMGVDMAAAGTAAEVAAMQNQGFNFAMDSLKGSIETLQITLGSYLLPIITAFINDALIPGVGVAQTFAQAIFGNSEAFAGLSPQLQAVVTGVQGMIPVVMEVASLIAANWQPALAAIGAVIGAAVLPALASAVVAIAPVVAAVVGAIAIGAALYGAWQSNFAGVQTAVQSAMTAVQGVITSVLGVVMQFWNENGAEITASAQRWWGQAQEIIGTAVAAASAVITNVFTAVAGFIDEHGAEIQAVLSFAWETISNVIDLAMNTIQGIVTTVLGIVTGDWETAAGGIETIVEGIGTYISEQFTNIKNLITEVGPDVLAAAQSVGQSIIDGIAGAISGGVGAIKDAAMGAAQAALDAAKELLGISSPSRVFADEVGFNIAAGMAAGVTAAASLPIQAVASVAGSALGAGVASVAGPMAANSFSYGASYGDTINVDARGATATEGQIAGAVGRVLDARSSRADRLSRTRGGFG